MIPICGSFGISLLE